MKLESAIVAALMCSLVVNVAHAAHAHPFARHARPVATHRAASMPATTLTWTEARNSYRSVGR